MLRKDIPCSRRTMLGWPMDSLLWTPYLKSTPTLSIKRSCGKCFPSENGPILSSLSKSDVTHDHNHLVKESSHLLPGLNVPLSINQKLIFYLSLHQLIVRKYYHRLPFTHTNNSLEHQRKWLMKKRKISWKDRLETTRAKAFKFF